MSQQRYKRQQVWKREHRNVTLTTGELYLPHSSMSGENGPKIPKSYFAKANLLCRPKMEMGASGHVHHVHQVVQTEGLR